METRRFDELTVTLAQGGSRRAMLRSLAGGVLGALALDRSSALAKKDKQKPEKGGGRPITIQAKPLCGDNKANCPTCYEARFGVAGTTERDGTLGCCKPDGREAECRKCTDENKLYCSAEPGSVLESQGGTCVVTTCKTTSDGAVRCNYTADHDQCAGVDPAKAFCCRVFSSPKFGHCVASKEECCTGATNPKACTVEDPA